MSLYVIVAVRKGAAQRPCGLCALGQAERGVPGWVSEPVTAAASEVIELIRQGRKWRRHSASRGTSVASRPVRVLTDDEGRERLASAPAPSSTLHTLFDLPEF